MLYEDATSLVYEVADPASDERLLAELRIILAELRARGLTGVHNIEDDRSLRLLQRLRASGELTPRVLYYIQRRALPHALELGIEGDFGDDILRFAGVKLYMDGALGSQTAAMLDPYEGQPENRGLLTTTEAEVEKLARDATMGASAWRFTPSATAPFTPHWTALSRRSGQKRRRPRRAAFPRADVVCAWSMCNWRGQTTSRVWRSLVWSPQCSRFTR